MTTPRFPRFGDDELILASHSPRRRQLLEAAGYRFRVIPPEEVAEGDALPGETAESLVARLARRKAADVVRRVARGVVLGCDTVVECEGEILGKPADRADARRMLERLSGNEHRVLSGLCVWRVPGDRPRLGTAVTRLRMDPLDARRIEAYLDTGQWAGKAGAFGYQDGVDWVHVVAGSESNVVGLPLELLGEMLDQLAAEP